MLEIDILRNSSQFLLGVLRGAFQGFGCPKRHPDALLAKTMVATILVHTTIVQFWYLPQFHDSVICQN